MKLLISLLILSFISLSHCKLIRTIYYNGTKCQGTFLHQEISSLCNFLNSYEIETSKVTSYVRNTSAPYNCDKSSFSTNGISYITEDCYSHDDVVSFKQEIIDGDTYQIAVESLPENSCNDILYVDGECANNFYIASWQNNTCHPVWLPDLNTTSYMKISCNSSSLTTRSYADPSCAGTPTATTPSSYPQKSCNKVILSDGKYSNDIYHSFYAIPANKPTQRPHIDGQDPNNAIKLIPSILILISILISLIL